jgi:hypothetical protein
MLVGSGVVVAEEAAGSKEVSAGLTTVLFLLRSNIVYATSVTSVGKSA